MGRDLNELRKSQERMWGLKAGQTANAKTQIRVCLIFFEDSEKAGVPKEE